MKKFFILLTLALGAMLSTGCGCMVRTSYVPQYCQDDVYYHNSNYTFNGTYIAGDHGCPTGLYWANASLTRWGMIVKVKNKDGAIIKQYDLRIPRQRVEDTFYVTGLTGKPLEVHVYIRGGYGSVNYVIVSGGDSKETYNLRRN